MSNIAGLPKHLGGHGNVTHTDIGLLEFARDKLNCKSILDIGCGPGGMVYEAIRLGIEAKGVDGDFVTKRENPELFEMHDFTKGKLEHIKMNFDMVWCCEFIEHVEKQYEDNWITLMQKGKYVFVTYSIPGKPGHHHVNCEPLEYWLKLFDKYGFKFRDDLTKQSKELSTMKREFWNDCGLIFERV
jgi:2-polyprenyl-3-methyl-5-hydroxy-6-metoxy-1,4-benzoquinol methylase